ncbi:BtrH N-terminal domain-containing protein [Streptomyces sp. S1]|uniref:BtrH N-terminal domain-containing protein n=1 Tax=Streptomyces sp. S1 TaxID=718288 RepID=UPI003D71599E
MTVLGTPASVTEDVTENVTEDVPGPVSTTPTGPYSGAVPVTSSPAWYDDLCSCLQVDLVHVLRLGGWDPLQALGSGWRLRAVPEDCEPVEFFHPAGEDLASSFGIYHPLSLRWHRPGDDAEAHEQVVAALADGIVPVVAVDNYHLPFRPAYHDVHAGHLLMVTGYDPGSRAYRILDPMPPAYRGPLPREVLERSRSSANPDDGSDPFFAGSGPARRWLEVRREGPQPELTWSWLRTALETNVRSLRGEEGDGLPALAAYFDSLPAAVAAEGAAPLLRTYRIGWPAQAEAGLHARFLAEAARRLGRFRLAEAGRAVELVSHSWTGVRISAAHGEENPGEAARQVVEHGRTLLRGYEAALHAVESALDRP